MAIHRDHIVSLGCNGAVGEGIVIGIITDDAELKMRTDGDQVAGGVDEIQKPGNTGPSCTSPFPGWISSYSVNLLLESAQSIKPNIKPSMSTPKGWLLARA